MKKRINEYLTVNSSDSNDVGELYIEGDISDYKFFEEDITVRDISNALKEMGSVKKINLYINSYGGSCTAGNAMISIIDDYKLKNNAKVAAHIRGIAASMGSGVAMVADVIYMADNALLMIHKPSADVGRANSNDLEKAAEWLDKTENALVKNYMRHFNGTEEELRKMLENETVMTAEEAKEHGFVDYIEKGVEIAACAKDGAIKIGNQVFNKKIADYIEKKNIKTEKDEKGASKLHYDFDKKLSEYGISNEMFDKLGVDSNSLLEVLETVKDAVLAIKAESAQNNENSAFLSKDKVCEELNCDDITVEQLLDYAKAGKDIKPVDAEIENKAKAYDEILDVARENALKNAIRAYGDECDEARTRKMLKMLNYKELAEQSSVWEKRAEKVLNAGVRVSEQESIVENNYINPNKYFIENNNR